MKPEEIKPYLGEVWVRIHAGKIETAGGKRHKEMVSLGEEWIEAVRVCFPDRCAASRADPPGQTPDGLIEWQDDGSCLVAGLMLFVNEKLD